MARKNIPPEYTVCYVKKTAAMRDVRAFIPVGVGWRSSETSFKMRLDVPLLLSPDDELYLFQKEK